MTGGEKITSSTGSRSFSGLKCSEMAMGKPERQVCPASLEGSLTSIVLLFGVFDVG
jgi:hypothetical protein